MNKSEQNRRRGLLSLYGLLVIVACLIRQFKYGMLPRILLVVTILAVIILWKFLLQKKIINLSFFSNSFQKNLYKEERWFLNSAVFLISPIFKLRNISVIDVLITLAFLFWSVTLCIIDEKYEKKKV
ncbi:hypothetical protein [Enterococcus timonensis]|uniref:hypothetical protein n=1 Tax=Enterococcus timonensis TaxID=1852364 RepID=UPI0008DAEF95|nr:hypothetical protein [Enterococcus timonensis]